MMSMDYYQLVHRIPQTYVLCVSDGMYLLIVCFVYSTYECPILRSMNYDATERHKPIDIPNL